MIRWQHGQPWSIWVLFYFFSNILDCNMPDICLGNNFTGCREDMQKRNELFGLSGTTSEWLGFHQAYPKIFPDLKVVFKRSESKFSKPKHLFRVHHIFFRSKHLLFDFYDEVNYFGLKFIGDHQSSCPFATKKSPLFDFIKILLQFITKLLCSWLYNFDLRLPNLQFHDLNSNLNNLFRSLIHKEKS